MKKLVLVSILALASCATIMDEKMQPVKVSLDGATSAECTFKGNEFETKATIPGTVELRRSYYPVDVNCGNGTAARIFSDVSEVGYISSVAGIGVGGVVDASTGHAFEYPEAITLKSGQSQQIGLNKMNSNVAK